jgi:calmodulin
MSNSATADDKEIFSQAFIIFDRNGDGSVDASEFKAALAALGRGDISDDDLKAIMGGDSLNHDQFVTALSNMKNGTANEQEIMDALSVFDKGNGYVNSKELRNAMVNMGSKPLSEAEADVLMKHADVDGDGQINYKSWATALMNQTVEGSI